MKNSAEVQYMRLKEKIQSRLRKHENKEKTDDVGAKNDVFEKK